MHVLKEFHINNPKPILSASVSTELKKPDRLCSKNCDYSSPISAHPIYSTLTDISYETGRGNGGRWIPDTAAPDVLPVRRSNWFKRRAGRKRRSAAGSNPRPKSVFFRIRLSPVGGCIRSPRYTHPSPSRIQSEKRHTSRRSPPEGVSRHRPVSCHPTWS